MLSYFSTRLLFSILVVLLLKTTFSSQRAIHVDEGDFSEVDSYNATILSSDHLLVVGAAFQIILNRPCLYGGRWSGPLYISGKQFTVYYDLGSDWIVVPLGGTNGNKAYQTLQTYTPTGPSIPGNGLTMYGGGTTAQGSFYADNVGLSTTANVPNFQFLAATTLPNINDYSGTGVTIIDGILGMSATNIVQPNKPVLPLFFQALFDSSPAIQRKLSLLPQGNGDAILTVGGDFTGFTATDVFPLTGDGHWQIGLTSVTLNGKTENFVDTGAGAPATYGVLDTGSISIVANDATVQRLFDSVPGFTLYADEWRGPCGQFPNLLLTFQGSASVYTVSLNRLEVKSPAGDCIIRIRGIQNFPTNIWLLGIPFLRSVYTQLNFGPTNGALNTNSIGLSQPSNLPPPNAASGVDVVPNVSCVIS